LGGTTRRLHYKTARDVRGVVARGTQLSGWFWRELKTDDQGSSSATEPALFSIKKKYILEPPENVRH